MIAIKIARSSIPRARDITTHQVILRSRDPENN